MRHALKLDLKLVVVIVVLPNAKLGVGVEDVPVVKRHAAGIGYTWLQLFRTRLKAVTTRNLGQTGLKDAIALGAYLYACAEGIHARTLSSFFFRQIGNTNDGHAVAVCGALGRLVVVARDDLNVRANDGSPAAAGKVNRRYADIGGTHGHNLKDIDGRCLRRRPLLGERHGWRGNEHASGNDGKRRECACRKMQEGTTRERVVCLVFVSARKFV